MKSKQTHYNGSGDLKNKLNDLVQIQPQLVTVFGSSDEFAKGENIKLICKHFPNATVVGCSTAGEISEEGVFDGTIVVTAIRFETDAKVVAFTEKIKSPADSYNSGQRIAKSLDRKGLKAVFFMARGLNNNCDEMLKGVTEELGEKIPVSGGMAGDGMRFAHPFTVLNGEISSESIVGFGIYGEALDISHGSLSGWEPFGPVRRVTRAEGAQVFEIDGEPALDTYKKYLGEAAKELPGSGQRYPFALLASYEDKTGVIRGMIGCDEKAKSLQFGGDIPQNSLIRLMRASSDNLIRGAKNAAELTLEKGKKHGGLALLVSCVARKHVLGQNTEDEVDAVKEVLGDVMTTGFYAYGEIGPAKHDRVCKWHNQTMTITYISEKKAS